MTDCEQFTKLDLFNLQNEFESDILRNWWMLQ